MIMRKEIFKHSNLGMGAFSKEQISNACQKKRKRKENVIKPIKPITTKGGGGGDGRKNDDKRNTQNCYS